ncbi:hypothetical protein HDU88_006978 [Geranomyces variabilis]|nr:hypothetical protein HDU88_006978 [Geranomyces variabilis]
MPRVTLWPFAPRHVEEGGRRATSAPATLVVPVVAPSGEVIAVREENGEGSASNGDTSTIGIAPVLRSSRAGRRRSRSRSRSRSSSRRRAAAAAAAEAANISLFGRCLIGLRMCCESIGICFGCRPLPGSALQVIDGIKLEPQPTTWLVDFGPIARVLAARLAPITKVHLLEHEIVHAMAAKIWLLALSRNNIREAEKVRSLQVSLYVVEKGRRLLKSRSRQPLADRPCLLPHSTLKRQMPLQLQSNVTAVRINSPQVHTPATGTAQANLDGKLGLGSDAATVVPARSETKVVMHFDNRADAVALREATLNKARKNNTKYPLDDLCFGFGLFSWAIKEELRKLTLGSVSAFVPLDGLDHDSQRWEFPDYLWSSLSRVLREDSGAKGFQVVMGRSPRKNTGRDLDLPLGAAFVSDPMPG